LGLNQPIVVGHSLGGELAIEVAKRLEGRCGGLVMVDCSPDVDNSTLWNIRDDFYSDSKVFNGFEEYVEALTAKRPAISRQIIDVLIESALRRSDSGYVLKRDPRLIDQHNWSQDTRFIYRDLRSIVCSSYLIRGEASSVLSSRSATRLISQFRDCQLRVIPGAGHAIMQDNPIFFDITLAEIMLAQRV
jgi:pimeloyl-ACP methyl ester carboxylesterase